MADMRNLDDVVTFSRVAYSWIKPQVSHDSAVEQWVN